MQALPGSRDFLPDELARCAITSLRAGATIARRHGFFIEWDGPAFSESTLRPGNSMPEEKRGAEIVDQAFQLHR